MPDILAVYEKVNTIEQAVCGKGGYVTFNSVNQMCKYDLHDVQRDNTGHNKICRKPGFFENEYHQ